MPFNELQRHKSFPPTIVHLHDSEAHTEDISDIDENPISFFLTPPESVDLDFEFDDDEDLSAGIESSSKVTPVREISPSSIQRSVLPFEVDEDEDEEEFQYGFAVPISLKEFQTRHSEGRTSRQEHRAEDKLAGLGGKATVKMTPLRSARGRGQTRSLSARRPHSWRLPSPEIGPIQEERESDDGEDNKKVELKKEMSLSAPPSPEVAKNEIVKPKKRVHWA
jgi:hypothetical protein